MVETLTTEPAPTQIAVLRLDTDFYESTKAELQHLWPKVVSGGELIVDDYFSWDGCRRACDEFFTSDTKFEHIDGPAVRYIKP